MSLTGELGTEQSILGAFLLGSGTTESGEEGQRAADVTFAIRPGKVNDIGDLVEITATITDAETGAPADPELVTCSVRSPDKSTETATPERIVAGDYLIRVEPDQAGRWHFGLDGTGGHQVSEEGFFKVRAQSVPR